MKPTPRAPRLLVIVENNPFGVDHRVRKQTAGLVAAGYRITAVSRRHPDNAGSPGVRVYDYRSPPDGHTKLGFVWEYAYSWAMAAVGVARVWLSGGVDAVQLCGPPDMYFPLALPFRLLGKPVVIDQRDLSPEVYSARYGRRRGAMYRMLCLLEKVSLRAADHVITVNDSLRDIIRTRDGLAPGAVTVVGNGPLLAETHRRAARPELKHGRRYLCCWAGMMGPQDRVDLALRAVDHYVHGLGRTDCHFVFLGDGDARAQCVALAASLGLDDWVSFPGFVPFDEVLGHLWTADLGLDSNPEEFVSPVKAMEYMACRLPFAAFDLKETRRLADGAAAYADAGDVRGLARLVAQLLDDPARRAEMARVGRRLVEEKVAWDHQQEAYLGVFRRLLEPGVERPGRRQERPAAGRTAGDHQAGVVGHVRSR